MSVISQLAKQVGFYSKSFLLFSIIALLGLGYLYLRPLAAGEIPKASNGRSENFDLVIQMTEDGSFYVNQSKLGDVETVTGDSTYRFRYQVIDRPTAELDSIDVALKLPKPLPELSVAHRFINNGGAISSQSSYIDPQTILYSAIGIGSQAQLTLELEVPKEYVSTSALFEIQQRLLALPPVVWTGISIALPALTLLLLLMVALARSRRIPTDHLGEVTDPPSRLSPALLGILLKGRITNREIAATLIDLARRGHLVIHQISPTDYRFARRESADYLQDYEEVLLDQIFGPASDRASGEEIGFSLAQELFSKRTSEAFILTYKKVNDLGYFYTNPLTLHRRYQVAGIFLFLLGVVGLLTNLLIFAHLKFFILFWIGMMVSALLVAHFSRGLPARTVVGDRELARWLAFAKTLTDPSPVSFSTQTQDKYLAYLPYAVVMDLEVEWTKRFYELPFTQPGWYLAARITTVDEFANKLFPLFGYLSHTLALSAQPGAR